MLSVKKMVQCCLFVFIFAVALTANATVTTEKPNYVADQKVEVDLSDDVGVGTVRSFTVAVKNDGGGLGNGSSVVKAYSNTGLPTFSAAISEILPGESRTVTLLSDNPNFVFTPGQYKFVVIVDAYNEIDEGMAEEWDNDYATKLVSLFPDQERIKNGVNACDSHPYSAFGGQIGKSYTCLCPITYGGIVYGSDTYHPSSDICKAAEHSGVISSAGGIVTYTIVSGLSSYVGSDRNGVSSSNRTGETFDVRNKAFNFSKMSKVPVQTARFDIIEGDTCWMSSLKYGICSRELYWSVPTNESSSKLDLRVKPRRGREYPAFEHNFLPTTNTTLRLFDLANDDIGRWDLRLYKKDTDILVASTSLNIQAPPSFTVATCTTGLGKSVADPKNALICDATANWKVEGAKNAYVLISGDYPYSEKEYPYGHPISVAPSASQKFWVTEGNYRASLYVNGELPTADKRGTGVRVAERTFSIKKGSSVVKENEPVTSSSTCGRMIAKGTIALGQSLTSCNKAHTLTLGTDGNLTLTGGWTSGTAGSGATTLSMQNDGNLVLYTKGRKAVWSLLDYVGGKMGAGQYLQLKDDGTLAVYNQKGEVRWDSKMMLKKSNPVASSTTITVPTTIAQGQPLTVSWTPAGKTGHWIGLYRTGTTDTSYTDFKYADNKSTETFLTTARTPGTYEFRYFLDGGYSKRSGVSRGFSITTPVATTTPVTNCGKLLPGQTLTPGRSITSCNGAHTATFGTDGNFTFGAWNSRTAGQSATRLVMQNDGNLVVYAGSRALWSLLSHDGGRMGTGQYLELRNDGTLAVYNAAGAVRWSTAMPFKTVTPPTPTPTPTTTVTGTITTPTPCVVGVGKSTSDPKNAVICDQTINWSTTNNPTNVRLVITGAFPYDTANFASGYAAGTGPQGPAVPFWVTAGTYRATLFSGTTKLDEKTFTIAPAVLAPATPATTTSQKSSLNQMASVLEALRALLGGWR